MKEIHLISFSLVVSSAWGVGTNMLRAQGQPEVKVHKVVEIPFNISYLEMPPHPLLLFSPDPACNAHAQPVMLSSSLLEKYSFLKLVASRLNM